VLCATPCERLFGLFDFSLNFHEILFDSLTELSDMACLSSVAGELGLNFGLRTGRYGRNFPCVSSVNSDAYPLVTSNRPLLLPSLNFTSHCPLLFILPRKAT
jgi:hypothetical protein